MPAGDAGDEFAEKILGEIERETSRRMSQLVDIIARNAKSGVVTAAGITAGAVSTAAKRAKAALMDFDPDKIMDEVESRRLDAAIENEARLNSGIAALREQTGNPDVMSAEIYAATGEEARMQRAALHEFGVTTIDCKMAPSGFIQTTVEVPIGMPEEFHKLLRENSPIARVSAAGLQGALAEGRRAAFAVGLPGPDEPRDLAIGLQTGLADPGAQRAIDWLSEVGILPAEYQADISKMPTTTEPGFATLYICPRHAEAALAILDAAAAEVPEFEQRFVENRAQIAQVAEANRAAREKAREAAGELARGRASKVELEDIEVGDFTFTAAEVGDELIDILQQEGIECRVQTLDGAVMAEIPIEQTGALESIRDDVAASIGFKAKMAAVARGVRGIARGDAAHSHRRAVSRVAAYEMRDVEPPRSQREPKRIPGRDRADSERMVSREKSRDIHTPTLKK